MQLELRTVYRNCYLWELIQNGVHQKLALRFLSQEDIEKCKDTDILEQLLSEMAGTFPSLTRVFVDERDVYLANSLKQCAKHLQTHSGALT